MDRIVRKLMISGTNKCLVFFLAMSLLKSLTNIAQINNSIKTFTQYSSRYSRSVFALAFLTSHSQPIVSISEARTTITDVSCAGSVVITDSNVMEEIMIQMNRLS